MAQIKITTTIEGAASIVKALDVFSRLSIGQLEIVAEIVVEEMVEAERSPKG